MSYRFRRMTRDDLPMAHRWLETPEVRRWWSDPDGEVSLDAKDLDDPHIRMWIVSHADRAFAYLQDYSPHDWPMHHFGHLPPGSRGIDQFIGDADMIGRGHGPAFIRVHVDRLFGEGAPVVVTDPDPSNARAIRAYQKAGFTPVSAQATQWGPALLMLRVAHLA
jgi:aminoglycoside 6'-N-acetyltransferase